MTCSLITRKDSASHHSRVKMPSHHHYSFRSPLLSPLSLHIILSSFVLVVVMAKFANNGSAVILHLSPPPQSDNFIHCYFNPSCFCKTDQRTEIYESLIKLWLLARFNATEYKAAVAAYVSTLKQEPSVTYYMSEPHILAFARAVTNSSTANNKLFQPGPIFDIECADVAIAAIPTDYNAGGVISHVSVTGSKLSMLDGSAFAGLEVQGLRLSRNHLFFISEYAFSSLSNSLTMLDLSLNSLDEIPFLAFKSLKLLEWLNLCNNQINSVTGDWLTISLTLRKLLISSNSIDILPPRLFSSFPRLSWLGISSNFIHNITRESLPPNLQTLDLTKNRFSDFPSSVFHLRSLSWLLLGGNGIEAIPHSWPKGAGPLQMNQLDLSENFIQIWPSKPFGSQLTLFDLSVSKNYLQSLPAAAFESMNIFRLSLGYNRIHMIDPAAFNSLELTLKYLNLENNRLKEIPWLTLGKLSALMHFYIGSNQIESEGMGFLSSGGAEQRLPPCKLTYLGLNGNQISRFPKRTLIHCSRLVHINLGYNQIEHLDELAHFLHRGKKFKALNTLILRNNPFRTLAFTNANTYGEDNHWMDQHNNNSHLTRNSSGSAMSNEDDNFISSSSGSGINSSPGSSASTSQKVSPSSILNVFQPQVFPNLRELSLSFCQIVGELEVFPSLPLTTLEISMGLRTARTLTPYIFQALNNLEWLALDHNTIHTISDYTFYSNRKLNYLNLEWNRLTTLPAKMFHPEIHRFITHLRLSHNEISTIAKYSFISFPAFNLDLSYNLISTIEKYAFSELNVQSSANNSGFGSENLATNPLREAEKPGLNIYLQHNRLTTLKPLSFAVHKLSLLDLSFNRLRSLNFEAFLPRTLIGGLNCSHNEVEKVLPSGKEIYLLKFLDLSFNRIGKKGIDLRRLCVTELIDLSHNKLEELTSAIFPVNCSMKELDLRFNAITTVDPGTFSNLPDLTVLRLAWNQIRSFSPITLIKNSKLRSLDLSHNRLRTLPRDSLLGTSLEILELSWNQFVNLPLGALTQVSRRLKRLDMSHNSIEHLDSTMFESIPGLLYLNLSSNRLSILPDSAFANLASLRELDLSRNALRTNFKELFHFLPKLKLLRLSGCGIKAVPFLPLPHLLSLDLSRNGMKEMKMQNVGSLPRLRSLDLSSNELTSSTLPPWTPLYNLVRLKLSNNPLKSMTKDTFYGLGRLEELELLDMGRIDRFDEDVFTNLTNLRKLGVETYSNIEKYRFRLGPVLSSLSHLEELFVNINETTLSDQLIGGILPKLRKLTITGSGLKKIEANALEGLENCFHVELTITKTSIEEVPPKVFELLQSAAWTRLDLSFNKISSLDWAYLYPNKTLWFSRGTKTLEGGLVLDGNEFICDCDLVWIGEWLRRWLRESFQSHSTDNIPLVNSMYESIRKPCCTDSNGRVIPLIELYSDVMCHASALSGVHPPPNFLSSQPKSLVLFFSFLISLFH